MRRASISSAASTGSGAIVVFQAPWKLTISGPSGWRSTMTLHASPLAVRDAMTKRRRSAMAGQGFRVRKVTQVRLARDQCVILL